MTTHDEAERIFRERTAEPSSSWGEPTESDDLEGRLFVNMQIAEGVLELIAVADYVDRRFGDVVGLQLPDFAIHKAAWGASRALTDANKCMELILSRRKAKQ